MARLIALPNSRSAGSLTGGLLDESIAIGETFTPTMTNGTLYDVYELVSVGQVTPAAPPAGPTATVELGPLKANPAGTQTSITFTSQTLTAGRKIFMVGGYMAGTITVTFNGNSVTQKVVAGTGVGRSWIGSLVLGSGATGSIVITFNSQTAPAGYVVVYDVQNYTADVGTGSKNTPNTTTTITATVAVDVDGLVFGNFAAAVFGAPTPSWSTLTQDVNTTITTQHPFTTAQLATSSSTTLSQTVTTTSNMNDGTLTLYAIK